jgi:TnpA family transposase
MPRRSILSAAARDRLLAMPDTKGELIRHCTFNETDLSMIRQPRGPANRLGCAVQLCSRRFPGIVLGVDEPPLPPWRCMVATQLKVPVEHWDAYGQREQTRREPLVEWHTVCGFKPFTMRHYRPAVHTLTELAWQTDQGIVLASALVESLRRQTVIRPAMNAIERVSAEASTRANRRIDAALTTAWLALHDQRLDDRRKRKAGRKTTWLAWLRQSPAKPNARHRLEHMERRKTLPALDLPVGLERQVHQNRRLKIAREGGPMTPADVATFASQRRYATLVALAIAGMATVTDEIIDRHDRILGKLFNAAKNTHQQQFQASGKAINDTVRLDSRSGQALREAKQRGGDPFAAIASVISWDAFTASVSEAQKRAPPEDFDCLHRMGERDATLRRDAPQVLDVLQRRAAPAAKGGLDAIDGLRGMNADNARKVPTDAPTEFIKHRWETRVRTDDGLDRRDYELCALSERKNARRSGDIWVQGSRQFKDFDAYLVPAETFATMKLASAWPLAVATDGDPYRHDRLRLLDQQRDTVSRMAAANDRPDAIISASGLTITPLHTAVPEAAHTLIDQTTMLLPHVNITALLLEVDAWTGCTRHFTPLKTGAAAQDKTVLLTTILADAINLGLTKMAESCPGTTYAQLSWRHAWHIRDETDSAARADRVNAQFRPPFADNWGDGTTSSSAGQRFKVGGQAESPGPINPKSGAAPGRLCYTPIADQYAPCSAKVVNVGGRDSTDVLDGLLDHESDVRIEEHDTDTAGFTDPVFALMPRLGFRFAPRLRDLGDPKLYIPKRNTGYDALEPMIGGPLNITHICAHGDAMLRLATSIKQGTVTASLMLRQLGRYPRQNGLAVALRELGRIARTLFILDWLPSVELRRRVHDGLNQGAARNAWARAVFFYRVGEMRDRRFEQPRYRASGLHLVTAAIVLWNTGSLERATNALRGQGPSVDAVRLQNLSPLGWAHVTLTGDYRWRRRATIGAGKFRPLRPLPTAYRALFSVF